MEEKRCWRIEQRWLKGSIIDSIRVKCKKNQQASRDSEVLADERLDY
jgi:hypothetical protein